jgi:hypothetical protein
MENLVLLVHRSEVMSDPTVSVWHVFHIVKFVLMAMNVILV